MGDCIRNDFQSKRNFHLLEGNFIYLKNIQYINRMIFTIKIITVNTARQNCAAVKHRVHIHFVYHCWWVKSSIYKVARWTEEKTMLMGTVCLPVSEPSSSVKNGKTTKHQPLLHIKNTARNNNGPRKESSLCTPMTCLREIQNTKETSLAARAHTHTHGVTAEEEHTL